MLSAPELRTLLVRASNEFGHLAERGALSSDLSRIFRQARTRAAANGASVENELEGRRERRSDPATERAAAAMRRAYGKVTGRGGSE